MVMFVEHLACASHSCLVFGGKELHDEVQIGAIKCLQPLARTTVLPDVVVGACTDSMAGLQKPSKAGCSLCCLLGVGCEGHSAVSLAISLVLLAGLASCDSILMSALLGGLAAVSLSLFHHLRFDDGNGLPVEGFST